MDYSKGFNIFHLPDAFYNNEKCALICIKETGHARDFPTYINYMAKEDFPENQQQFLQYHDYNIMFGAYVGINNLHKRPRLMKNKPIWNVTTLDLMSRSSLINKYQDQVTYDLENYIDRMMRNDSTITYQGSDYEDVITFEFGGFKHFCEDDIHPHLTFVLVKNGICCGRINAQIMDDYLLCAGIRSSICCYGEKHDMKQFGYNMMNALRLFALSIQLTKIEIPFPLSIMRTMLIGMGFHSSKNLGNAYNLSDGEFKNCGIHKTEAKIHEYTKCDIKRNIKRFVYNMINAVRLFALLILKKLEYACDLPNGKFNKHCDINTNNNVNITDLSSCLSENTLNRINPNLNEEGKIIGDIYGSINN